MFSVGPIDIYRPVVLIKLQSCDSVLMTKWELLAIFLK